MTETTVVYVHSSYSRPDRLCVCGGGPETLQLLDEKTNLPLPGLPGVPVGTLPLSPTLRGGRWPGSGFE